MSNTEAAAILVSGVTGAVASYLVYAELGIYSAITVLIAASWLTWRVIAPGRQLNTLSMLLMPPKNALLWFMAAFLYMSLVASSAFEIAFLVSLGTGLLGGVIGIVFYNLWNP